jgi:hypothetical protein
MSSLNTTKSYNLLDVLSGTALSFFYAVTLEDVVKTIILTTIGAVVSFTISFILKKIEKNLSK